MYEYNFRFKISLHMIQQNMYDTRYLCPFLTLIYDLPACRRGNVLGTRLNSLRWMLSIPLE